MHQSTRRGIQIIAVIVLFLCLIYGPASAISGISEEKVKASRAWFEKGGSLFHSSDYQAAIKAYDKAIKLNPVYYKAYNSRGNVYFEMQEYDKAVDDYTRAIELNPRHHKAYTNRGIAYRLNGRYDKAIQDYTRAIALVPKYYRAYYNRGIAYHYKKLNLPPLSRQL